MEMAHFIDTNHGLINLDHVVEITHVQDGKYELLSVNGTLRRVSARGLINKLPRIEAFVAHQREAYGAKEKAKREKPMRTTDKLRQARAWLDEIHDIFGDESDRDLERPAPYLIEAINCLDALLEHFSDEYDEVDANAEKRQPSTDDLHDAGGDA
jgi:hypothetical protein